LDKIVNAFVPPGGATTMTTTAITTGGITTVKKSAVAAHVAGDVFAEVAALHASRTPQGANGTRKRATPRTPGVNHAPATAPIEEEHP
jgi:hypothetical protein